MIIYKKNSSIGANQPQSRIFIQILKFPLQSARGNISILILGFLGILIVGTAYHLMSTHDTNLTSNKSLKENIDVDMMMSEIKLYLRSKASCTATFGTLKIGDTANRVSYFGDDRAVTKTYISDTNQFHATGTTIPLSMSTIQLDSIRLLDTSFLSPTANPNDWNEKFRFTKPPIAPMSIYTPTASTNMSTYLAVFRFTKSAAFILRGRPEIVRVVPIEVALNAASEIESCYYDSNSSESTWIADACNRIFGGTIVNSQCAHTNIKSSLSTDGYFCFNNLNVTNPNLPGDIHSKHCVTSWYFEQYDCRIIMSPVSGKDPKAPVMCSEPPDGAPDLFMVGFSTYSCGKKCVKTQAMCCKSKLKNTSEPEV
jgi:hypothetical protein